jgi:hypothetical protein
MTTIDSFTEGNIQLRIPDGDHRTSEDVGDYYRSARLRSFHSGSTSSVQQEAANGLLRYTFSSPETPSGAGSDLSLTYGILGIGESEGFLLDISDVQGAGELLIAINGSDGLFDPTVPRVALDSPGALIYPASLVLGFTPENMSGLFHFLFIPTTANFSLTLSEIAVIPEPSTLATLMLGFALLSWKKAPRQRHSGRCT